MRNQRLGRAASSVLATLCIVMSLIAPTAGAAPRTPASTFTWQGLAGLPRASADGAVFALGSTLYYAGGHGGIGTPPLQAFRRAAERRGGSLGHRA